MKKFFNWVLILCMLTSLIFMFTIGVQAASNDDILMQTYENINATEGNCRLFLPDDYDGDGVKEAFAVQGIWEEGLVNGNIWFINSAGSYRIVQAYVNGSDYRIARAGNNVFFIWEDSSGGSGSVSYIFSCKNGEAYSPVISGMYEYFREENGKYYGDISDFSLGYHNWKTEEFIFDENTLEFVSAAAATIDINYLTKYYWYYDSGIYSKYEFHKDSTYTVYDYNGNIFNEGSFTLNNNILTLNHKYNDGSSGSHSMIYVDKNVNDLFSFLPEDEKIFWDPDTGHEYIGNTYEEVPINQKIKVVLNGSELQFDQPPIMRNDRVMVPIRAIFEALGYNVIWHDTTQTATASNDSNTIIAQINNPNILYNEGTYVCDVSPMLVSDRTLVPVRAVSECAGCTVNWNEEYSTVIITSCSSASSSVSSSGGGSSSVSLGTAPGVDARE